MSKDVKIVCSCITTAETGVLKILAPVRSWRTEALWRRGTTVFESIAKIKLSEPPARRLLVFIKCFYNYQK
jgi:hypothetical protein